MQPRTLKPVLALALAGTAWGLTIPLSKVALGWLGPAWLTAARFLIALPILAAVSHRHLRHALRPGVIATGALGFGAVLILQNAGITRTSVSHAALLVGAVPVLVALIAASRRHSPAGGTAWTGYLLALIGVGLIAGTGSGGATAGGDLLVLASAALSALYIYLQPGLLAGRDPAAVTAVQFGAGALAALPVALISEPLPSTDPTAISLAALAALVLIGTVLPFWLFAYGQARLPARQASAFVNLEPVVGAAVGWLAFGNRAGTWQMLGALAVLGGVALSGLTPGKHQDLLRHLIPPKTLSWRQAGGS